MRRGFPITRAMRAERRARAEARQKEYDEKYPTPQAKLDALPATGATKQRAKLQAQLKLMVTKLEKEKVSQEMDQQKTQAKQAKRVKLNEHS